MTVKELKIIVNSLPENDLGVRVEIQEDGMGTTYPLSVVHYDGGKIYLLGGDHEKDGQWEVGTIVRPRELEANPTPRIATCGSIGGQMVQAMINASIGRRG